MEREREREGERENWEGGGVRKERGRREEGEG